ncbi:hypothetical protein N7491_006496 [Penicillium cf. griseofulvum]|uniref:Uncharacterized protein n=1 Tax=Penicillium cf. griseofulvum TaxID=2972120 RepID=A0A9W9M1Y9_9EURO|nr:hypothetical protein N7472_010474 [Penicillium cf. griseofulvum]KAJ5429480.1 hypothetical protein N7491_006496 [Penicillium cf. griseofulvum]
MMTFDIDETETKSFRDRSQTVGRKPTVTEVLADCDPIDAIVDKVATIAQKDAELNTLEAQRIIRLNEEILQHHHEYNEMGIRDDAPPHEKSGWQKHILQQPFNLARRAYADAYEPQSDECTDDDTTLPGDIESPDDTRN